MDKPKVRIRAFRATDDQEGGRKFLEGHTRVLEAHGISMVTSAKADWISDPTVFVILVESLEDGRALGGARVQASIGDGRLPIEKAVGNMDKDIYEVVREKSRTGAGELCGLWNSIQVAGLGIGSYFSTRASLVISEQLGLNNLFTLCAPRTVRWIRMMGARVLEEVGNDGTFYYPKIDLIATAAVNEYTHGLETTRKFEAEKIRHLRENLQTTILENSPGRTGEVEIEYDLRLEGIKPNEFIIS